VQLSGTEVLKGENGINVNGLRTALLLLLREKTTNALVVVKNILCLRLLPRNLSFAPITARLNHAGEKGGITKSVNAPFAGKISQLISIVKQKRVRGSALLKVVKIEQAGRADVYCITVPDSGHFALASGLIVSNCDEMRYRLMTPRRQTKYGRTYGLGG
jgi:hypothetical protein